MIGVERFDDGFQPVMRMWSRSVCYSSLVILVPMLAGGVGDLATVIADVPAPGIERVTPPTPVETSVTTAGSFTVQVKKLDLATIAPAAFGDNE